MICLFLALAALKSAMHTILGGTGLPTDAAERQGYIAGSLCCPVVLLIPAAVFFVVYLRRLRR